MSRLLTIAEVAAETGLTEWSIGEMIRSGRVAHLRVGAKPKPGERDTRPVRFTGEQVAALIAEMTVEPTAADPTPRRRQRRRSA